MFYISYSIPNHTLNQFDDHVQLPVTAMIDDMLFVIRIIQNCCHILSMELISSDFIACPYRACYYKLRVCVSTCVSVSHALGIGI